MQFFNAELNQNPANLPVHLLPPGQGPYPQLSCPLGLPVLVQASMLPPHSPSAMHPSLLPDPFQERAQLSVIAGCMKGQTSSDSGPGLNLEHSPASACAIAVVASRVTAFQLLTAISPFSY